MPPTSSAAQAASARDRAPEGEDSLQCRRREPARMRRGGARAGEGGRARPQGRGRRRRRPARARGEFSAACGDVFRRGLPAAGKLASINAYLGAFPIAAALKRGADIVITGRGVDSAVTLGACIHAFGWTREDVGPARRGQASAATSSNAARRRRAAISPTGRRSPRRCGTSATRSRKSAPTAPSLSPSRKARAALLPSARSASRCSTRSAIRRPTSCPMWSAISRGVKLEQAGKRPRDRFRREGPAGAGHLQGQRHL